MKPGKHKVRNKKLPVVQLKRFGKNFIRARPTMVTLTEATVKSAGRFGVAARIAGIIRKELAALLPGPKDRKMQYRFNRAVGQWIKMLTMPLEAQYFKEFNFNGLTSISARFKADLTIDWGADKLRLQVPAFHPLTQVSRAAQTTAIEMQIRMLDVSTRSPFIIHSKSDGFQFPLNDEMQPAREFEFPLQRGEDMLHLLVLVMKPLELAGGSLFPRLHPKWLPVDVIAVRGGNELTEASG